MGCDQNTKKSTGAIKFVLECTMIKLNDHIDLDLWIDDIIPLELDYFSTDDVLLEYMGAHSKLPK